ncbi:MAG TPA: hypothetical protein VFT91_05855 [Dehalococcoidia bacterium]|nr:hypothetical protein [Dehalococcoidia bacterium]
MRVTAFVTNLVGAVSGLFFSFIALLVAVAVHRASGGAEGRVGRPFGAALLSAFAIVLASLIQARHGSARVLGLLILGTTILSVLLIGWFYAFPAVVLVVGVVLCFFVPDAKQEG